jgi:hypothetical protein
MVKLPAASEIVPSAVPFTKIFTPGRGEESSPEVTRPETVVCPSAEQIKKIHAAAVSSARSD